MSVLMELEKPNANKGVVQVDSSDDEAAARSLLDQITPAATSIQPHVVEYSKTFSCFSYQNVIHPSIFFFLHQVMSR